MVCPQGGLFLVGAFSCRWRTGGGGVGLSWDELELVSQHHLVPVDGRAARVRTRRFPRHPPLPLLPSTPMTLRLFSPTADVENPSAITDAVKVVEGKLDGMGLNLLINNAGIYTPTASLETVDAEDMVRAYKTNAVGPMLMAQVRVKL